MADNKIALITGAAGFIGSHTVQEFVSRGWFVYAVIHRKTNQKISELKQQGKLEIFQADLSDAGGVATMFESLPNVPRVVIHCAGRASDTGWACEFKKANLDSVKNLGKMVMQHGIEKFVFVSTTDVYGMKDFYGEDEAQLDYDSVPRNNYPKFKILAEKWIKNNLPQTKWCILRPAAVWGDDDPTLTKRLRDFFAASPFILHFGKWKGQNRWPAVSVDAVAKANFVGATNSKAAGQAINVIDEQMISVDEFYRMIISRYFPGKTYRTLYLPYWLGWCLGAMVSGISNAFNLSHPFIDPSLYALQSVSCNLDFSGKKLQALIKTSDS